MNTVHLDVRRSVHCATDPTLEGPTATARALSRPGLPRDVRKPFRHNVLHAVRRDDRLSRPWFMPFIPDPPRTDVRPVG